MEKPNILLIMVDELRSDYLNTYNLNIPKMKNIDSINTVVVENCITSNPICQPARCALLTGRYTHQIGMLAMSGDLNKDIPTFPQALQRNGYKTYGIGKFHYLQSWHWDSPRASGHYLVKLNQEMKKFGYDEVWETAGKQLTYRNYCECCKILDEKNELEFYRDFVHKSMGTGPILCDDVKIEGCEAFPLDESSHIDYMTKSKTIEYIKSHANEEKPFYMMCSFSNPHPPLDPPKRFLDMVPYEEIDDFIDENNVLTENTKLELYRMRQAYKALNLMIDEYIGEILDALKQQNMYENTVIIFTGDHGEMLGDHGRLWKSVPYKESVNIPLMIKFPNNDKKIRYKNMVELTDVTATILDIAGADYNVEMSKSWPDYNDILPAKSLLPVLDNENIIIRDVAFSECDNKWQSVESQRYKYIKYLAYDNLDDIDERLYDKQTDPKETVNIISENEKVANWHRKRLQFILDKTPAVQQRWANVIDEECLVGYNRK